MSLRDYLYLQVVWNWKQNNSVIARLDLSSRGNPTRNNAQYLIVSYQTMRLPRFDKSKLAMTDFYIVLCLIGVKNTNRICFIKMVAWARIELATQGFSVLCSTD